MYTMDSTSEKSKRVNCKLAEDRISNLPTCVIGRILSLVPTKNAVSTSVLSKRWKVLWTFISSMDFKDGNGISINHGNEKGDLKLKMSFIEFVYHVLLKCRSMQLSTFCLECSERSNASHVASWISTVLKCNVQELDICVSMGETALLPPNLFICGTLVELKLGKSFIVSLPTSVQLPHLKVLSLDNVKLLHEEDDDAISRLIGGCPVLEELRMLGCIGKEVKVINISAPVLTSLDLTSLSYDGHTDVSRIKIMVETPQLSYLLIDDYVAQGYQFKDLDSLSKASIDVGFVDEVHREPLKLLLEAISRVEFLEFKGLTMEAIVSCKCELPIFPNVSELDLGYSNLDITWDLLLLLLKKMPCLASLTFANGLGFECYKEHTLFTGFPSHDVPHCLLFCLKTVEIWDFEGKEYERVIVEYFLKNAKVLDKLIIHDNFLGIPRASHNCKVELV